MIFERFKPSNSLLQIEGFFYSLTSLLPNGSLENKIITKWFFGITMVIIMSMSLNYSYEIFPHPLFDRGKRY